MGNHQKPSCAPLRARASARSPSSRGAIHIISNTDFRQPPHIHFCLSAAISFYFLQVPASKQNQFQMSRHFRHILPHCLTESHCFSLALRSLESIGGASNRSDHVRSLKLRHAVWPRFAALTYLDGPRLRLCVRVLAAESPIGKAATKDNVPRCQRWQNL